MAINPFPASVPLVGTREPRDASTRPLVLTELGIQSSWVQRMYSHLSNAKRCLPPPLDDAITKRLCLSWGGDVSDDAPTSPDIEMGSPDMKDEDEMIVHHAPDDDDDEDDEDDGAVDLDLEVKFARSRSFSQTHRDNERLYESETRRAVSDLTAEDALLNSLLSAHNCDDDKENIAFPASPSDTHGLHVSAATAQILGMCTVSPSIAAAMLEFIAARRNYFPLNTSSKRRRRRSLRAATSAEATDVIIRRAIKRFAKESRGGDQARREYISRQLQVLSTVHAAWAADEGSGRVPELDMQESIAEAPDAGGYLAGPGARRCKRCRQWKTAGSGHGRSKCSDGTLTATVAVFSRYCPFVQSFEC